MRHAAIFVELQGQPFPACCICLYTVEFVRHRSLLLLGDIHEIRATNQLASRRHGRRRASMPKPPIAHPSAAVRCGWQAAGRRARRCVVLPRRRYWQRWFVLPAGSHALGSFYASSSLVGSSAAPCVRQYERGGVVQCETGFCARPPPCLPMGWFHRVKESEGSENEHREGYPSFPCPGCHSETVWPEGKGVRGMCSASRPKPACRQESPVLCPATVRCATNAGKAAPAAGPVRHGVAPGEGRQTQVRWRAGC